MIVLESPDPLDLLQGRSEAQTLATACRIVGYETASFNVRSAREFKETCKYIATITKDHDDSGSPDVPLFVHISCHGNEEGLTFGADHATWDDVVSHIKPLCKMPDYPAGCVLSISACGAGHQEISRGLSKSFKNGSGITPPHYLFVTDDDDVKWDAATVAWLALYHRLGRLGLENKQKIQNALQAITELTGLVLAYFRWDKRSKKFKRFPTVR